MKHEMNGLSINNPEDSIKIHMYNNILNADDAALIYQHIHHYLEVSPKNFCISVDVQRNFDRIDLGILKLALDDLKLYQPYKFEIQLFKLTLLGTFGIIFLNPITSL